MRTNRFARIIETLVEHDVRFIVVGGLAAVLQRVPVVTVDLDVVHDRRPDNVERLLAALAALRAVYRNDPRQLTPNASHLIGPGSHMNVRHLVVLGVVAGVGFTMALFIAQLAFTDARLLTAAKIGVLAASGSAAICGLVLGRLLLAPVGAVSAAATADEAEDSTAANQNFT